MGCVFEGTGKSVFLRGHGSVNPLLAQAFEAGMARQVTLRSADLEGPAGRSPRPITLRDTRHLDPISIDEQGGEYSITYSHESPDALEIVIASGVVRRGTYIGTLENGFSCPAPDGCQVRWIEAEGHHVALDAELDTGAVSAASALARGIRLTAPFPFGDLPTNGKNTEAVLEIHIRNATGVVTCDGAVARKLEDTEVRWKPSKDPTAAIRVSDDNVQAPPGGIFVQRDGLWLRVVATDPPVVPTAVPTSSATSGATSSANSPVSVARREPGYHEGGDLAWWVLPVGVASVALVAAFARVLLLRRRRATAVSMPDPANADTSAATVASTGSAPHLLVGPTLLVVGVSNDAPFLTALQKHFAPVEKLAALFPGTDTTAVAFDALERVPVVVLAVSADILAPTGLVADLVRRAVELHQTRALTIVPLILRPCNWEKEPYKHLSSLPADGRAVSQHADPDTVWSDVARAVESTLAASRRTGSPHHGVHSTHEPG